MSDGFTPARVEALRLVVEGDVRIERFNHRLAFFQVGVFGSLRAQPYRWLLSNGYITRGEHEHRSTRVIATEKGRQRLAQEPPR